MGCLSVRRLVADSLLLCWLAQPVVFFFGVDHFWIVPLFLAILSCCRSNRRCYIGIGDMRDGVGIHPVSLEDPIVATYLILCDYNMPRPGMLPFIFPVQKNLQLPVQVPMGFLTRPVTADQSCYGARYDKYTDDYNSSLHHMRVPLILPSTSDTAIAEMNRPASMYNKSI